MIDSDGYIKMVNFCFAKQVKNKTYTLCGTPEYMAPEIILRKGYDEGVDYWATGVLIWECETGETPFADKESSDITKIFQNILRRDIFPPQGVDQDVIDILIGNSESTGLLNRNTKKRLGNLSGGAGDIVDQPYFAMYDFAALLCKGIEAPYKPAVDGSGIDQRNFDRSIDDEPQIETYWGDISIFAGF